MRIKLRPGFSGVITLFTTLLKIIQPICFQFKFISIYFIKLVYHRNTKISQIVFNVRNVYASTKLKYGLLRLVY